MDSIPGALGRIMGAAYNFTEVKIKISKEYDLVLECSLDFFFEIIN
jgi:hypothetical protein